MRIRSSRLMMVVLAVAIGLLALLAASLFWVTPEALGPYGITVWFLLLFVAIWGLVSNLSYGLLSWAGGKDRLARSLQYGGLTSGFIVLLAALNSLRQLDVKDIVLVSLLVLLTGFYLRKA